MKRFVCIISSALCLLLSDINSCAASWREIPDQQFQAHLTQAKQAKYDFEIVELKEQAILRLVMLKDGEALKDFWKEEGSKIPIDLPGLNVRLAIADFLIKSGGDQQLAQQLLGEVAGATTEDIVKASLTEDRIKSFNAPTAQEMAIPFPPERKRKIVNEAIASYKDYITENLPLLRTSACSRLASLILETKGIEGLVEATKKYKGIETTGPYFQNFLVKVVKFDE